MFFLHLFSLLLICFAFYSFLGWIIEVFYRSIKQGRFVNAGFLHGCFVPVYGVSAFSLILLDFYIGKQPVFLQFLFYAVLVSSVEYAVGVFSERVLHARLWDYSGEPFNLYGRVCLPFSIVWGGLGVLLTHIIHPFVWGKILLIVSPYEYIAAVLLVLYFVYDFSVSVSWTRKLGKSLEKEFERMKSFNYGEFENLLNKENHIVNAFESLRGKVSGGVYKRLEEKYSKLLEENRKVLQITDPSDIDDAEYLGYVADILAHAEFQKTKLYKHHKKSIFDHALKVSYLAYKISKTVKLNAKDAARAGLLHDFFLYDWRNSDDPGRPLKHLHGFHHPKIALENSKRYFNLSELEKDIIVKHMWPLTPMLPKYRESFLITFLDKYVTLAEWKEKNVNSPTAIQ